MTFKISDQIIIKQVEKFSPDNTSMIAVGAILGESSRILNNVAAQTGFEAQNYYYNARDALVAADDEIFVNFTSGSVLVTTFPGQDEKFLFFPVLIESNYSERAVYIATTNVVKEAEKLNLKSLSLTVFFGDYNNALSEETIAQYMAKALHDRAGGQRLPFEKIEIQTLRSGTYDIVKNVFADDSFLDVPSYADEASKTKIFYYPKKLNP